MNIFAHLHNNTSLFFGFVFVRNSNNNNNNNNNNKMKLISVCLRHQTYLGCPALNSGKL